MANEAVIVELSGQPKGEARDFTITDTNAVEKGAIMGLSDPRTCSGSAIDAVGGMFAGIAAAEKVASDGQTNLACWTKGIFDLTVAPGGIVDVGNYVSISGANLIKAATVNEINCSGGSVIGRALEAGSASEVIEVAVGER